jgi:hypothetical protein
MTSLKKVLDLMAACELYQTFKELKSVLLKLFQKTKEKGIFPDTFYGLVLAYY